MVLLLLMMMLLMMLLLLLLLLLLFIFLRFQGIARMNTHRIMLQLSGNGSFFWL